jgi:hypothetical protein
MPNPSELERMEQLHAVRLLPCPHCSFGRVGGSVTTYPDGEFAIDSGTKCGTCNGTGRVHVAPVEEITRLREALRTIAESDHDTAVPKEDV